MRLAPSARHRTEPASVRSCQGGWRNQERRRASLAPSLNSAKSCSVWAGDKEFIFFDSTTPAVPIARLASWDHVSRGVVVPVEVQVVSYKSAWAKAVLGPLYEASAPMARVWAKADLVEQHHSGLKRVSGLVRERVVGAPQATPRCRRINFLATSGLRDWVVFAPLQRSVVAGALPTPARSVSPERKVLASVWVPTRAMGLCNVRHS